MPVALAYRRYLGWGVTHGAYAGPEGAVVLDVFVPIREDFRAAAGGAQ